MQRALRTLPRPFHSRICCRNYSSELPRTEPVAETFSAPSKPRQLYSRPVLKRDLPAIQRSWPVLVLVAGAGLASWALFYKYAANQERLCSSITLQILKNLRDSTDVQELLGDAVRPEPVWYLNGDPWVDGVVNMSKGNIDLKFRIKGHKGAGTLHFTSIRRAKGEPFTILRFKVISDDGKTVNVSPNT